MDPTDDQTTGDDAAGTPTAPNTGSPGVGQTYDRSLVYSDDDKLWREKYTGQKGRADELERELNKMRESRETALNELKTEIEKRESKIEELSGKLTNAGEQLGELQALKDQLPELEQQARRAAKLERVLEYPDLVNKQVTDLIETEDGQEVEMKVNPVMNLVLNSNLEGDELTAELERLNRMIKADETPKKQETNVTDNAVPGPGEEVEETPEYWIEKAKEAQLAANNDPSNRKKHVEDMIKYSEKAEEARKA